MPKFEIINGNIVCGSEIAEKMARKGLVLANYGLTPAKTQAPTSQTLETLYNNKKKTIRMENGSISMNKSLEAKLQSLLARQSEAEFEQIR